MKRSISIFLITAILFVTAFGSFASALVFSDAKATDYYYNAALELADKGILSGYPDGTFGASKTITRAEMSAIICRILECEDRAKAAVGRTVFTDVADGHWASGYINIARKEGIINGDGNGLFRPESPVRYEEAIKMVICAFGMGGDIEIVPDDWSYGYIKKASENGILDSLKGKKGENSTRGDVAVMVYNAMQVFRLTDFSVSNNYFLSYKEDDCIFTVDAGDTPRDVSLYRDGVEVCAMTDDGRNGDYIARDGIYTCTISAVGEANDSQTYYAQSGDVVSDEEIIYFFGAPEKDAIDETMKASDEITATLKKIEADHANKDGVIEMGNIYPMLDEWEEYLKENKEDLNILYYEVSDTGVYIKYADGFSEIISPDLGNVDGGSGSVSLSVKTFQPYLTEMTEEGHSKAPSTLPLLPVSDTSAEKISANFSNCKYKEAWNYDDSEVTLDRIKGFGPNEVILWHGHGFHSERTKSILWTGEIHSEDEFKEGGEFYEEVVTDVLSRTADGRLGVTYRFIDKYCSSLSNSFFYLGTCSSGQSSELADSLLKKGASAVIANSRSIERCYNLSMMDSVISHLCRKNTATDNYYTLGEALKKAKGKHGEYDSYEAAEVVIFGGQTAEDYRLGEAAYSEYSYYGDAKLTSDGVVELTPLDFWRSGSVWYQTPFDTSANVEIRYSYWAGGGIDEGFNGADGILCMFAAQPGLGSDGEYMGFVEGDDSWGIEVDSYPFNENDPEEKHIAIVNKDIHNHVSFDFTDKTDDSRWHDIRIAYKKNDLQVYLDGNLILMYRDIVLPETCYIGFSAATGADMNKQLVKDMSVSTYKD